MLCNICPRRCGAERTETRGGGVCAMPAGIVAAKAMLHQWEEPVLSGTNGAGLRLLLRLQSRLRVLPER